MSDENESQDVPPRQMVWLKPFALGVARAAAPGREVRLHQDGKDFFVIATGAGTVLTAKGDNWQVAVENFIQDLTVRKMEAEGTLPDGFVIVEGPPAG